MTFFLWLFIGLILYCYFGYPLAIALLAKYFPKPVRKSPYEPTISVVISAYNEEDVIKRKIDNLLSINYLSDKMEILIGSDGSSDNTNNILSSYTDHRLRIYINNERHGKMKTVAKLISMAKGDIIVFNDTRQILDANAIANLVANFTDPAVGCASGELILEDKDGGATAKGINAYWEYEKFIRNQESTVHSMLGATGAFYAIRKNLYKEGPANIVLDDMYTPLRIIQQGYRAIFDGSAHAYDKAAHTPKEEHNRKARTLYGNYQIFGIFPDLFNPFVSPIAIQFFSHKFLRVIVPFLMLALIPLNILIVKQEGSDALYASLLFLQILFYTMASLGLLLRNHKNGPFSLFSKLCYIPYVFCLLNFSALAGFYRFISARQSITWDKARA